MAEPAAHSGLPVALYVDDDAALRRVVTRTLQGHFQVLVAESAAEASEVVERFLEPIDVLLMDINLPDGWGSVLAQRLKESRPEMAVVYTTGFAESDPILAGALNDAPFVLRKPFSAEGLVGMLKAAMGANRASG